MKEPTIKLCIPTLRTEQEHFVVTRCNALLRALKIQNIELAFHVEVGAENTYEWIGILKYLFMHQHLYFAFLERQLETVEECTIAETSAIVAVRIQLTKEKLTQITGYILTCSECADIHLTQISPENSSEENM